MQTEVFIPVCLKAGEAIMRTEANGHVDTFVVTRLFLSGQYASYLSA